MSELRSVKNFKLSYETRIQNPINLDIEKADKLKIQDYSIRLCFQLLFSCRYKFKQRTTPKPKYLLSKNPGYFKKK